MRDLNDFMIRTIEKGTGGTYNVAGPGSRQGMHAFIHGVHAAISSEVDWVMVPDSEFLKEQQLRFAIPWLMPEGDRRPP